jgi:kynurenine formamidase
LFGPGIVIDVSGKASSDSDFRLTAEHVRLWEAQHGRVPEGAIVFLHTGWGRFWDHVERYRGRDASGRLRFPGYAADAAELLVGERNVRGLGIDTLSVDYGLSRDFPVHKVLGQAGRYALENVANLDKLPPRDFYVFVAPIKIETGSGGPARVLAIVAK